MTCLTAFKCGMKHHLEKLSIIIFCVLASCILAYAQNDAATDYYNSGIELFKKGEYRSADSLFTLSLNKYSASDAFANRAIARLRLGNEEGFCNDIYMATANGDSSARNLFLKKCTVNDTTYFDTKTRIIARHKYDSIKDSIIIDSSGRKFWYNPVDTLPGDSFVLSMPVFPGKEEGLLNFLRMNIHYPAESRNKGIQGIVYVAFVVSNEGNVKDIKILRGINDELDAEAIRVISIMPQWFPGIQKGRFMSVQYNLPIQFVVKNK